MKEIYSVSVRWRATLDITQLIFNLTQKLIIFDIIF